MTWRLLLASFIATSGLLFAITAFWLSDVAPYSPEWLAQTTLALAGLAVSAASYFVFRGYYWSLSVLRVATVLSVTCVVVLAVVDYVSSAEPIFVSLAFYGWIMSFPVFFFALLWHPQVVAEFRGTGSPN